MKLVVWLTITILVLSSGAVAQGIVACNTETTRGLYGYTCSGWLTPAQGAPLTQVAILGSVEGDVTGTFVGTGTLSIGGSFVTHTVTGKANLSADCSGTISYDQKVNGQPAPKLNITFQVVDEGKEIRGLSTDPGTVLLCNLKRIRK